MASLRDNVCTYAGSNLALTLTAVIAAHCTVTSAVLTHFKTPYMRK